MQIGNGNITNGYTYTKFNIGWNKSDSIGYDDTILANLRRKFKDLCLNFTVTCNIYRGDGWPNRLPKVIMINKENHTSNNLLGNSTLWSYFNDNVIISDINNNVFAGEFYCDKENNKYRFKYCGTKKNGKIKMNVSCNLR